MLRIFKILYVLVGCFTSLSALAGDWVRLEKGLHYRNFTPHPLATETAHTGDYIHAFRINPQRYEIKALFDNNKRFTVQNKLTQSKALIAINANYFDNQGKALGLIVQNGKIQNPFKNISWWGILRLEDDWLSIAHSSEYNPKKLPVSAIQAGPRLIVNKAIPKLKDGASQRSAIGITKKGELIILSVHKPITLTELAQIMLLPEKRGGLECIHALNLDGGSSTQMAAKIGDFELKLPSYISVPAGLGVFRK